MLGATKNMAVKYVILIVAFLAGLYAVGWTQGYSTFLPQVEYGALLSQLNTEFTEPFSTGGFYLWIATAFSLIVGTCGLPHVLVRFYTVESERTARWSTVWGLFFICLLYLSAPAFAAFGTDLYAKNVGDVYGASGMSGAEGDVIVVLASQLANLPTWFVGLVAAGGIAAAIATTAGLFIAASSAAAHDIYTNIFNSDATQRQQLLIGRATIVALGAIVTVTALDPPALVGELVALAFSLAGLVLFPMFFLGLWWENANRPGALAGMTTGLVIWVGAVLNELVLATDAGPVVPVYADLFPAVGAALLGTPIVFAVTIGVSLATDEPPERIKRIVRQCHSPKPMGQQQSAEDVVSADGGPVSTDGGQVPSDDDHPEGDD